MSNKEKKRQQEKLISHLERHYAKHGSLNNAPYIFRAFLNDYMLEFLRKPSLYPRLRKIGIDPTPMMYITAFWKKHHRFPEKKELTQAILRYIKRVMTDPSEKVTATKLRHMGCTLFEDEYKNTQHFSRSETQKRAYIAPGKRKKLATFERLVKITSDELHSSGRLYPGTIEYVLCTRWEKMLASGGFSAPQREIMRRYKMLAPDGSMVNYKEVVQ